MTVHGIKFNAVQDQRGQGAKEATGSTVGADEMPGFLLDALRACRSESLACDNAMEEANR